MLADIEARLLPFDRNGVIQETLLSAARRRAALVSALFSFLDMISSENRFTLFRIMP